MPACVNCDQVVSKVGLKYTDKLCEKCAQLVIKTCSKCKAKVNFVNDLGYCFKCTHIDQKAHALMFHPHNGREGFDLVNLNLHLDSVRLPLTHALILAISEQSQELQKNGLSKKESDKNAQMEFWFVNY